MSIFKEDFSATDYDKSAVISISDHTDAMLNFCQNMVPERQLVSAIYLTLYSLAALVNTWPPTKNKTPVDYFSGTETLHLSCVAHPSQHHIKNAFALKEKK